MFNRTTHLLDRRGFIRDWLVTDSWITPAKDLDELLTSQGDPFGKDGRWVLTNGPDIAPLKSKIFGKRPFVTNQELPQLLEGGPVKWKAPGAGETHSSHWRRFHTGHDGYVDWSHFSYTPEYRHSLMATQIEIDQPEFRTFRFESQGPIQVWLNGEIVLSTDEFGYMQPVRNELRTLLPSGMSTLIISQWQISLREVRHAVRVSVEGLPVRIVIPSPGADEYDSEIAERALEHVAITNWAREDEFVDFVGPRSLRLKVRERNSFGDGVSISLKNGKARLSIKKLREADRVARSGNSSSVAGDVTATMLDTGEVFLECKVDSPTTPVTRILRSAQIPPKVRTKVPKVDQNKWRQEVLEHVASNYPSSARALARLSLDAKYIVTIEDLKSAQTMIESRADCADFEAVGLVHILHRFPVQQWESGLRESIVRSLKEFKYWIDQPGLDAMCYFTENHQLVWHTAEHLIGDFFADEKFANSGFEGSRHRDHGASMALEWLKRKLRGGFSEFDSNAYLAIDTLALVSLLEFSPDVEIRRFAESLLDKMLFTLASNSWRGIHGAAHGRSYTTTYRSSRFEETAPIMWALWGMGSLNLAVLPVTSLVTSHRYELPVLIIKTAHSLDKTWEARQVYRGKYRFTSDLLERPYGSDLRIWRTGEGMLSSVQDYRSGLPGLQEHVWGITLSPEVQILASYPAAYSHATSVRPNAWAGHLVLPRTRQHKNIVFSIFPINEDLYPDFTHLWFPTPKMDQWLKKGSWLVGRVGDGYVAVATEGGFSPKMYGDTSMQEWIPNGAGELYIAIVENKRGAKSFKSFINSLREPEFDSRQRLMKLRRRNTYEFNWDGLFLIDGISEQLHDGLPELAPHLSNPAMNLMMDEKILKANFKGSSLHIDLETGKRILPKSRA